MHSAAISTSGNDAEFAHLLGNGLDDGSNQTMPASPPPTPIIHYSFIFTPAPDSVGVDWIRLLIPVLAVMLITIACLFTFQSPKQQPRLG